MHDQAWGHHIICLLYTSDAADDCSALYGGPRLDHALKRLQKMLNELTEWGRSCGLKFNPEKSIAVIFTRRRKQPPFALTIDGKEIEFKQEVKYLGITLDSKLHWTKHINDKIKRTKRYVSHIAQITRKNWGPKPKLMRWAYLGIVRPMLCYGAMIWGHRAPANEAKLRRINRMAINTFGSFPKSTPTRALEVMFDVMPLHLYCTQEGLAARLRLDGVVSLDWSGKNTLKTHNTSHLRHWETIMSEYEINTKHSDRCNQIKWSLGFRINRDSFNGDAKHRKPTQINVYTDGSRQNEQTGCGYAIYHGKRALTEGFRRLPDHATVFQAEITAITQAAGHLQTITDPKPRYVKFLVDSQAALMALENPVIKSRTVSDAMDALNTLATSGVKTTLAWIPAHKGHLGNERADTLAKRGAAGVDPNMSVTLHKPTAMIKKDLTEKIYGDWSREWQDCGQANHAKTFYLTPNKTKAKYVYKLARLEAGRLVRIITGHNNLAFFQNKLGYQQDSQCRLCNQGPETITHLLNNCPRLRRCASEIFKNGLPSNNMEWSVRALLEFSYVTGVNEMFEGEWNPDIPYSDTWSGDETGDDMLSDGSEEE